jgi:hypothetical protein
MFDLTVIMTNIFKRRTSNRINQFPVWHSRQVAGATARLTHLLIDGRRSDKPKISSHPDED